MFTKSAAFGINYSFIISFDGISVNTLFFRAAFAEGDAPCRLCLELGTQPFAADAAEKLLQRYTVLLKNADHADGPFFHRLPAFPADLLIKDMRVRAGTMRCAYNNRGAMYRALRKKRSRSCAERSNTEKSLRWGAGS